MKRLSTFLCVAVLGVATMGASLDGFREDEVLCEEAAARLIACCGLSYNAPSLECEYSSGCGTTQYPSIDENTSTCIRNSTCDALVANGVCDRASKLDAKVVQDEDGGLVTTGGSQGVCP